MNRGGAASRPQLLRPQLSAVRLYFSEPGNALNRVEAWGLPLRLSCVILRCPAAVAATLGYLGARDQCGGPAGTAILVAMGAEVGGG